MSQVQKTQGVSGVSFLMDSFLNKPLDVKKSFPTTLPKLICFSQGQVLNIDYNRIKLFWVRQTKVYLAMTMINVMKESKVLFRFVFEVCFCAGTDSASTNTTTRHTTTLQQNKYLFNSVRNPKRIQNIHYQKAMNL